MDRGAHQATVHGFTKSWTQLSDSARTWEQQIDSILNFVVQRLFYKGTIYWARSQWGILRPPEMKHRGLLQSPAWTTKGDNPITRAWLTAGVKRDCPTITVVWVISPLIEPQWSREWEGINTLASLSSYSLVSCWYLPLVRGWHSSQRPAFQNKKRIRGEQRMDLGRIKE